MKHVKQYPDLVELIDHLRTDRDESLLDKAEDYLDVAMSQQKDLASGLKSAFFVLNNKGKPRGYNPPVINQQGDIKITPEQLKQVQDEIINHERKS